MISTRHQFYDSETVNLAFLTMLKQIVGRSGTTEHLINLLVKSSYKNIVHVFSGSNCLWLKFISMQVKSNMEAHAHMQPHIFNVNELHSVSRSILKLEVIHKTFCSHEKATFLTKIDNVNTTLYRMLKFFKESSKQNASIQLGMLNTGSLVLVLTAFINTDFRLSSLAIFQEMETTAAEGGKSQNLQNKKYLFLSKFSVFWHCQTRWTYPTLASVTG